MRRTYELFMYFKQGSDLSSYLDGRSNSDAFRAWAAKFRAGAAACDRLAEALEGAGVVIDADNNTIMMTANDKSAEQLLGQLSRDGLIRVMEE